MEESAEEPPLRRAEAMPRQEHTSLRIEGEPGDADEEFLVGRRQDPALPPDGDRVEDDRQDAHEHRLTL
jgi:hypothetical protein